MVFLSAFIMFALHRSALITPHVVLMNWIPAIVVCCVCIGVLAFVAAISRHKKAATGEIHLLGAIALVDSALMPEGTVLVRGELWRARSVDGSNIPAQTKVHVVGLQGYFLLVERDT
ncbi:MAG: NfeD family protein [Pyrinomonadaceae bacterium]